MAAMRVTFGIPFDQCLTLFEKNKSELISNVANK